MKTFDDKYPVISADDLVELIKEQTEAGKMVWEKRQIYKGSIDYITKCGGTSLELHCYDPRSWFPKWTIYMTKGSYKDGTVVREDITDKKFRALAKYVEQHINKLDYDLLNVYKSLTDC
jgi:hypothetical protein